MKNSNVIDFFSKQSYAEVTRKEFDRNDILTTDHGVYLGCLKKQDTLEIRELMSELQFKRVQIDRLTAEWEELYILHQKLLQSSLQFLQIPKSKFVNLEKDTLMIGEDGHSWVIYDFNEKCEKMEVILYGKSKKLFYW